MDSPLILCNIQKCALEQVQVAGEQLGRRETKHFCSIGALRFRLFIHPLPIFYVILNTVYENRGVRNEHITSR